MAGPLSRGGSGTATGAGDVVGEISTDLAAERDELIDVLRGLTETDWGRATPAPGWSVHDQVAHLAHFDFVARLAIDDPDRFLALRNGIADLQAYVDGIGPANLSRTGPDMVRWWILQNTALLEAARAAEPAVRVPWFGPPMSLASKLTARLMETWAHGQDVLDALGRTRPPTMRLRHVARIGVLAFANSYRVRGLEVPAASVRVALDAPDGSTWGWGDPQAPDAVSGPAEDFCLVVTQRRHVADTRLRVTGPTARHWMSIAQAFAGGPGAGRAPGQFPSGPSGGHA